MALLQPFLSDASLSQSIPFSPFNSTPKSTVVVSSWHSLKKPTQQSVQLKKQWVKFRSVAEARGTIPVDEKSESDEKVLLGASSEEEFRRERIVADYDWTEEWYPLYLTQDVPDDAPLGLTVFDKQLVLYKDGQGELRCYEDRCPHR